MEKEILEEIVKECKISRRKAEELLKVSLFCGDSYSEAKECIKWFYLSKTCPK